MSQQTIDVLNVGKINVGQTVDGFQVPKGQNPTVLGYAPFGLFSTSSVAITIGTLSTHPFLCGDGGLFDQLAWQVSAPPGVAALCRIGLYDSDPITFLPRNLLFDSGDLNRNLGANQNVIASMNITLQAGTIYYPCTLIDGNTPGNARTWGSGSPFFGWDTTTSALNKLAGPLAYGNLPAVWPLATCPIGTNVNVTPLIFTRRAA